MNDLQTILLVEDDPNLQFVVADNLKSNGYKVVTSGDGEDAIEKFHAYHPDLCLLDIMLPKLDGFSVASRLREKDQATPIIFLTAKGLQEDKIKGLKIGGDDYITKPFSMEELLLKINIFLKRSSHTSEINNGKAVFNLENFHFDHTNLILTIGHHTQSLTQKEADILLYFLRNQNSLVKREDILISVWGDDDYFLGRSLDVFISKLRKYLKRSPNIDIQNHHGVGFKLSVSST